MEGSYDFDAPAFQDFAALDSNSQDFSENDESTDDWFQRREEGHIGDKNKSGSKKLSDGKEQKRGSKKREQCPSPTKKQKIVEEKSTHKNSTPRRSPRLLSKPKPASKPSHTSKNKQNGLTHAVSQPNVAVSGSIVNEKSKPATAIKGGFENVKGKSSEEIELEKIASLKEKLAASRKRNQESYKVAMTSKGLVPLKSGQPATLPEGFHFQSDQRIRGLPRRVPETKVKEFTTTLRSNSSKSTSGKERAPMGLTRPQPFKLNQTKSTSSLHATEKYQSVAERVAAFQNKTPERFKTKGEAKRPNAAMQSPHLTLAKTPTLITRARTRSVKVISREEEEEAEFKKHQKQQFKAHPVNHKILVVPNLGVHKVAPKPPTVPQEFSLHQNCHSQIQLPEEDEEERHFHANPVNRKILEGPVGLKPIEPLPLTVAQSPAFALRSRVRMPAQEPQQEIVSVPPKSHHVQHTGVPFKPRLEHTHTVPQPFVVEQRSKEMLKKKEEKIMQVYEEEKKAREFHAQLLPSDKPDSLPPKQIRPLTAPEPFKLKVDYRGQRYQEEYKSKIEEETKEAKSLAEFKARPNKVIFKTPFLPEKSAKPLTEVDSFALNTDIRAEQREQYNQLLKAHEAEVTAVKRQIEEQREHEENVAVAKLRQDMVHKATGIRRYKSVLVRPSDKPLTEAQSPYLRTQRITRKTSLDQ